ncbi:MAG: hypothetical protein HRU19_08895 [Pseudobacteriovorax sp.]|nr:hypothetical protein [Pseudobacteriovorax sp.]
MIRLLLLSVMFLMGSTAFGQMLKTKKKAKIHAEPKKKSTVIAEAEKDAVFESKGRKGMFWKIEYESNTGYVSVLRVKRVAGTKKGLSSVLESVSKAGRGGDTARVRSRSVVMGVRGLDESSDLAQVGNMKPDLRAVYRMEDRHYVKANTFDLFEKSISREIEKKLE